MSFMDTFERGMEKVLVPVTVKLNSRIHVSAIRGAFTLSFPIVVTGSLTILINFTILSPDGFITSVLHLGTIFPHLAEAQRIFTPVMNSSVNIMAILITSLVAHDMVINYQQDNLLCDLTAIGAFFVVYTPYTIIGGRVHLATRYLGPQGLSVAIIVALISSKVLYRLARNPRVTTTMSAAVPPAVTCSSKVLLPIFFVMIFSSILSYLLTCISPNGLNDLVYTLVQAPLKNMGTNIVTVLVLGLVASFLWVLGIYGPSTVAAIRETVFSEANPENLSYAVPHSSTWEAPYPITWTGINNVFTSCGGLDMALDLSLATFIASRRNDYRDLAKMAFVPNLFNINESVIFGLPVVPNPIPVIPFILVPFVNSLIGYFFISMEFVPPVTHTVPWTTLRPLIAFFGTDGNWLALSVGILYLAVSALIYLLFVIAASKVNTAAAIDQEDGDVCRRKYGHGVADLCWSGTTRRHEGDYHLPVVGMGAGSGFDSQLGSGLSGNA